MGEKMGNGKNKGEQDGETHTPCPVLCAPDSDRLGCRRSECLASALRTYFSPNTVVSVSALEFSCLWRKNGNIP